MWKTHLPWRLVTQMDYAARAASTRTGEALTGLAPNLIAAKTVSAAKNAKATSCVSLNGNSYYVAARALRAGTFIKSCAIRTKKFRYRAISRILPLSAAC
jgi:hypothetical protein